MQSVTLHSDSSTKFERTTQKETTLNVARIYLSRNYTLPWDMGLLVPLVSRTRPSACPALPRTCDGHGDGGALLRALVDERQREVGRNVEVAEAEAAARGRVGAAPLQQPLVTQAAPQTPVVHRVAAPPAQLCGGTVTVRERCQSGDTITQT